MEFTITKILLVVGCITVLSACGGGGGGGSSDPAPAPQPETKLTWDDPETTWDNTTWQ